MSLLAANCGAAALAAHVAVNNLLTILFMIPLALGSATTVIVGNALGEGNVESARTAARWSCSGIIVMFLAVASSVWVCRAWIARVFTSDAAVAAIIVGLVRPLAPFLVLDAVQTVLEGVIPGSAYSAARPGSSS